MSGINGSWTPKCRERVQIRIKSDPEDDDVWHVWGTHVRHGDVGEVQEVVQVDDRTWQVCVRVSDLNIWFSSSYIRPISAKVKGCRRTTTRL